VNLNEQVPRIQIIIIWLLSLVGAVPLVANLDVDGGIGLLWMQWTLILGLPLGGIALIRPVRWFWIPMGILSIVHLALGLGLHPHSSLSSHA
jgi:hypothetical protein